VVTNSVISNSSEPDSNGSSLLSSAFPSSSIFSTSGSFSTSIGSDPPVSGGGGGVAATSDGGGGGVAPSSGFNAPKSAFTPDSQHLGSFKYNEPLQQDVHIERNHPGILDARHSNPLAIPLNSY
jgi:hypothetical protein